MIKDKLLSHLNLNVLDKQRLYTFTSQGKKPSELEYSYVQKTIWLNKNPKDCCPSEYQIHNMFGRCVLTIMLFSIPAFFPSKSDLENFGYVFANEIMSFNLIPSLRKEKNVNILLSFIYKKLSSNDNNENKRKQTMQNSNKKGLRKRNLSHQTDLLIRGLLMYVLLNGSHYMNHPVL